MENLSTAEYVRRYIETYKRYTVKRSTYEAYVGYAKHINTTVSVGELTADDVQSMINAMYENGNSTSTIKHALTVLRQALEKARQKGIIQSLSALDYIEIPRRRTVPDVLTDIELETVIKNLTGETYCDLWRFMILTGCRVGEAIALQWEDVNFFNGTVHIHNTDYKGTLQPVKTAAGDRNIKMCVSLKIMLKRLKKHQNGHEKRVFLNSIGTKCSYRSVLDSWKRYLSKIGVNENIGLHALRHAFIHNAIRNGVPIKVISKWVGHADINITLKIYDYVGENELNEMAAAVDTMYRPPQKGQKWLSLQENFM